MAVSSEYKAFISEMLEGAGPVRWRGMFGGAGLYLEEVMFGLVFDEMLYFRADDINRPDYEAEGMEPFTYEMRNGNTGHLRFYEIPERLFDEPEEFAFWARKSVEAAIRVKATKKPKKPKAANEPVKEKRPGKSGPLKKKKS